MSIDNGQFEAARSLGLSYKTTMISVILPLMSKEEADKKAMELLERVGLIDKADSYPDMLSGGQKQRIAIAELLP